MPKTKKLPKLELDFSELFEKLGLNDLAPEEKQKRFEEMQEIVEGRIFLRIMASLDDEAKTEFDELSEDEFDAFFKKHDLSLDQIAIEEALNYREELIYNMGYLQGRLEESGKSAS